MSDLFSFIKTMTGNSKEFNKTKIHERGKHFFMVNRLMSISFPVQASYFNHIKINGGQAVSFWQQLLSSKYTSTPKWMWVSTKKEKEKKKALQAVSDSVIKHYCELYQLSQRDVNDALKMFPNEMTNELLEFEKLTKQ
jgi:hypothetical protein